MVTAFKRERFPKSRIRCLRRKTALWRAAVPGFIIRTHDRIGYVMLDAFGASSAQFEQGRVLGREEERNRIIKAFHDEVSSSIVAALFLMETARTELEQAGLPEAEAVAKASNILTETTEKIADAFSPGEDTRPEP